MKLASKKMLNALFAMFALVGLSLGVRVVPANALRGYIGNRRITGFWSYSWTYSTATAQVLGSNIAGVLVRQDGSQASADSQRGGLIKLEAWGRASNHDHRALAY